NTEFLWLIPITEAERNYKIDYGIEMLEEIFEEKQLNYLDFTRKSLI
ncbi:suppressor of fused domain protein, partial [Leptospira meyeri serovar Hardjo str. Went 5]